MLKKNINEIALLSENNNLNLLIANSRSFIKSRARKFIFDEDEIEDTIQEVSMKIFEKIDQFNPEKGCFEVWLQTITRRTCIDQLRKNKRTTYLNNKFDSNYFEPETKIYNQCDKEYLNNYLSNKMTLLSELQQKILLLKYYNDFSYEEIADKLNISINYARVEHFRALSALRNKIAA